MALNTESRVKRDAVPGDTTNYPEWKRAISAVLGGALVAIGFGKRSLFGIGVATVGGWLIYRSRAGRDSSGFRCEGTVEQVRTGLTSLAEPIVIEHSVTVRKSSDELYDMWKDADTVTRILDPVVTVENRRTTGRWLWTVRTPIGRILRWETEIAEGRSGEFLHWKPIGGRGSEGSVRFRSAPTDRGTEVTLCLHLDAPGGALGNATVRRTGLVPETLASKALYRFKSLAETGEIPTLEANPSARGSGDLV